MSQSNSAIDKLKASFIKCALCGNVTNASSLGICPLCVEEDQRLYEIARNVMRPNQNMSFGELCSKTGIDTKIIQRWIDTGRLRSIA